MSLLRRPAWWAVLLTLAGTLLFLRLGVWQLDRADEKEQLLRRYAAAETAPLRDFAAVAETPSAHEFPRVRLRGTYLADRIYLLDNPRHDQRGGAEVYAPFRPDGATRLILVDLGFLPGNGTDTPPQVPAMPQGPQELHGLYLPPPGVGYEMGGDALSRQTSWPKTTIYLDIPQVARDLREPLYPRVVALDADPASIFVREHQPDFSAMPPARHRAYAFQWFTFAVVAPVIFLILHRKRKKPTSDSP